MTRESEPLAISETLARIGALAKELDVAAVARDAEELRQRSEEGRFFLACLGQFKRGKSTLINALVGRAILPVGVVPVTAVVTVLRYGETPSARVRSATGEWSTIALDALTSYVSEAENPENVKAITGVEVFLPSALLRSGMCLVDTPGVGSVFLGNTEATTAFVPQIDAVLLVIGADPPLSGAELDLIRTVWTSIDEQVVVLNKADRLTREEIDEGRTFAESVLKKLLGHPIAPILEISAFERTKTGKPTRQWGALEARLAHLAENGAPGILRSAARRGSARLISRLLDDARERKDALSRPREESTARIQRLQLVVSDAERSLKDMAHLFLAVQEEFDVRFERERVSFMDAATQATSAELRARINASAGPLSKVADHSMEDARTIAHRAVDAWRKQMSPVADALFHEAGERFVEIVNRLLLRLGGSLDPTMASLPDSFHPATGLKAKPKFYFHDLLTIASPSVWRRVLRPLVGRQRGLEGIKKESEKYLARLLEVNGHRAMNDFSDQVFESRRELQRALRDYLHALADAAQRGFENAERVRALGRDAIDIEMLRVDAVAAELCALRQGL
jgi:ribosome biogenesis GTPase A